MIRKRPKCKLLLRASRLIAINKNTSESKTQDGQFVGQKHTGAIHEVKPRLRRSNCTLSNNVMTFEQIFCDEMGEGVKEAKKVRSYVM